MTIFSPKLYGVIKLDFRQILKSNYSLEMDKDDVRRHLVDQGDNMLFRQVRLITHDYRRFNRYVVFVDCSCGKTRQDEMRRLIHEGFSIGGQHFVVSERSASMVRTGILSFIDDTIAEELDRRITMGITIDKTSISKYSAYRGLCLSSCHCIEGWLPNI